MKINLSQEQTMLLERFARDKTPEAVLIKAILKHHISDLKDILNIDPKGNMGLQALARQESVKQLESIFDIVFPETASKEEAGGTKKISQWR